MKKRFRRCWALMAQLVYTTPSRYAYNRRLRGMLGGLLPARGGKVLDIGCGDGRYAPLFDGHLYIGIDIGAYDFSCRAGSARFFCRASAEQPPFAGGTFDLVFSSFMIEHVLNVPRTLAVIRDLLVPGGAVLISTGTRRAAVTGEMHRLFWKDTDLSVGQAHHYFDIPELTGMFESAGFEKINARPVGGPAALALETITAFFRLLVMKLRGQRYAHGRDSNETGKACREPGAGSRFLRRLTLPPLFIVRMILHEGSYWIDRLLAPLGCARFVVVIASAPRAERAVAAADGGT